MNILRSLLSSFLIAASIANAAPKFDADAVKFSVVKIFRVDKDNMVRGHGSGFVINCSGGNSLLATNHHVVRDAERLFALLKKPNGQIEDYECEVIALDKEHDLAILQAKGLRATALSLHINEPKQAEDVYAIGFPGIADDSESWKEFFNAVQNRKTLGVVPDPTGKVARFVEPTVSKGPVRRVVKSDWSRVKGGIKSPQDFPIIEHNASISGGNSGGPLFNECGHVVGVNTASLVTDGDRGYDSASHASVLADFLRRNGIAITTLSSPCDANAPSRPAPTPPQRQQPPVAPTPAPPQPTHPSVVAQEVTGQFVVIDLSGGTSASPYPISTLDSVPTGGWSDEYKISKLVLRRIEAGIFTMGSPSDELGRGNDEPQRHITLTKPYYIGVFEVTQRQWELVMGKNPSPQKGSMRPVESVSYKDIRGSSLGTHFPKNHGVDETSFMGKLRAKTGLAFDLPTEAQWEYACRAGTTTSLNSGKNLTAKIGACPNLSELAWYAQNSEKQSHPVGQKLPNPWGIYDMHGNVYEWCLDWYTPNPSQSATTDPTGAPYGSKRVYRGGRWYGGDINTCRSASRKHSTPAHTFGNIGFRPSITLP